MENNKKRLASDEILKQLKQINGVDGWKIIGDKGETINIRSDFLVDYLENLKKDINNRLVAMESVIESLIKLNIRYRKDKTLRNSQGRVNEKLRRIILERDNYTCKNCGVSGNIAKLNVDHIIPRSLGGKAEESNLQVLCKSCNLLKLARIFEERDTESVKEGFESNQTKGEVA